MEGEDLVEAGLSAGLEPSDVLTADEDVDAALLAEVSTLAHPPRVVGVFGRDDLPRGTRPVTLALWHVADPGNVGTLLRAADAFGAGVALSEGCADPTGPKAVRASMGAIFRVPLCGFDEPVGTRIALVAREGTPLPELAAGGDVVLVLGAERDGLPPEVLKRCDAHVSIPQPGGESRSMSRWREQSRSTSSHAKVGSSHRYVCVTALCRNARLHNRVFD